MVRSTTRRLQARKLRARIFDERLRMASGALNTVGVALFGAAFVFPVIRDENLSVLLEVDTWGWIAGAWSYTCWHRASWAA